MGSIRTETRRRVEVVSGGEYPASIVLLEIQPHQRIDRLAARYGVVLSDADHPAPAAIEDAVRIAQIRVRGDRPWLGPGILAIETLIREIREEDRTLRDLERASSVLVHPRSSIERGGREIDDPSV